MKGCHDSTELLREMEAASTAMESIRRAQQVLVCSSMLEGMRSAAETLKHSQLSAFGDAQALARSSMLEGMRSAAETLKHSQLSAFGDAQALARSSMLEGMRSAAEALKHSQLSAFGDAQVLARSSMLEGMRSAAETLKHSQLSAFGEAQVLARSSMLEGMRSAAEALKRSRLSAFGDAQALARSSMLEGIRTTQAALENSSPALHRVVRETAKAHVAEIEVTRERAQGLDLLGRRLRKVGQTATNRLVRLTSRRKVRWPVGSSLRGVAEFVFSRKSCEQIFDPLISDLRFEYCEALAANRRGKARWVRVRGYASFLAAVLAHVAGSVGDPVVRVWRIFRAGGS